MLLAASAAVLLVAAAAPAGADPVKVLRSIPFSGENVASQKVKDECELQIKVPHFLDTYSDEVELIDGSLGKSGRVLELHITQVHAPGGGAFSGAKSMTVTGVLRQNGREIGSFTATRYSGGGVFGGYKGTCAIVGRCAKAIGKDIADWLKNPTKDAKLGNA
ncbi:MAG: hypothetical protein OEM49_05520 [Myxococcales bacterium]|nr:hypothetical protein [Myxococcales bacterium]MDH5307698.1 hypothetical protein [Myxococcales bacterium]MDH5565597.1 hypothetical protein [Myxococcales bacterium]